MKNIISLFLLSLTILTTTAFGQATTSTESIVGIGATLEKLQDGTVKVDALIPNAPAERAGLAVGDILLAVKSIPTSAVVDLRPLPLPDIIALIRGPIGVRVEISFNRVNAGINVLSIVRDKFDVNDGD